jgi:hypothetical protein
MKLWFLILRMCVYMHSHFVENHPIWILEDGPLISEGVLSHKPKLILREPMVVTWSFDHSTIYRNLYLCLAIANDLSLAIGFTRIDRKVILMQLGVTP